MDYPMLCDWLLARGQPTIPEGILPKVTIVLEHDGEPVCVGALYMDNSVNVAHISWITTKPELSAQAAAQAVHDLLKAAEVVCRAHNYRIVFLSTGKRSLGRFLERREGFAAVDTCAYNMIKILE